MLYRVRGSLHPDTTHIATELRGLIAHTGPIRLGYLQMHGVAAQTIQVRDDAAAFFEETLLPKIGAAGSFIEHRAALRQPKELKLAATLCPMTATALPDLSTWGGVWSEVVYTPRRAIVRVRCLAEDADRIAELASQGWRVLRGPAALFSWLVKIAPFAPQFWPVRASAAAANASDTASALPPASVPAPVSLATAAPSGSTLTGSEVLAAAGAPNLLLGVTPTGAGVRLAWRSMIVAVQDGGERQDSVVASILFRAMSQGMGALVIAERAKVTPRLLSPLANRLRIIDMADPWESARIPWRTLPPEALRLLLGGSLPSPLPETLADALRASGRRGAATPVLEALTREPAYDLAGTLDAGGGVVLLLEPGASASLLASLLILGLSIAPLTRPLLICRPAALPMPPSLASRAVQFVFGDAPTAAVQLRATPGAWTALFPDGKQIAIQENLSTSVVEQVGADHAALVGGLQGLGWNAGSLPLADTAEGSNVDLGWPEGIAEEVDLGWPEGIAEEAESSLTLQEASLQPDAAAIAGLGWPEGIEEEAEWGLPLAGVAEGSDATAIADLGWPEELEAESEVSLTLQEASDLPDEAQASLAATDGGLTLQEASDLPDEAYDIAPFDSNEWPALLFDDALPSDAFDDAPHARRPKPHRRTRLVLHASRAYRSSAEADLTLQGASDLPEGAQAPLVAADEGLTLQEALDLPDEDSFAGLSWPEELEETVEADLTLQGASEPPDEDITDLVAAWHRGEDMSNLARELRRRRPALSLLDAMRTLKAAINAPPPMPLAVPAAHSGLDAVLRGLAAETPTLPEERDTLQSWRSGGQRRDVVREVAAAHGLREAEARAIYDRLVLPRVISDMNGSAAEVIRMLREPHRGDQATIPPPVMDCISRLLGTPKTNAGIARSLLPSLRETLAALDTAGRP